jgi:predicted AlkP superfamily pyrophosphatase or phosphodiesterase
MIRRHSKSVSNLVNKLLFYCLTVTLISLVTSCDSSSANKSLAQPQIVTNPDDQIEVTEEIPKLPTVTSQNYLDQFKDKNKIVIMISIDGFRNDYLKNLNVPYLRKLAQSGVSAEGMIPSFPSLTFPNHISLVTGRTPGHHGIVSNTFYDTKRKATYSIGDGATVNDGTWYKGEPIWTVLEQVGIKTATCFWVGSEAKINGIDPTYVFPYDGKVNNISRAQKVIQWLRLPESERPQFITLYFSDVDSAGHVSGPDSKEVADAASDIDAAIGKIVDYAKSSNLDIQYVIVSDHGMNTIETERVALYDFADLRDVTVTEKGATTQIYSDNPEQIEKIYADLKKSEIKYKVYRREEIPARWKFEDPTRTGNLLVVAEFPFYIDTHKSFLPMSDGALKQLGRSTHGWDPINPSMHALFIANGTMFKPRTKIGKFENVHVYPMVLDLFGVKQSLKIDGDPKVLKDILALRKPR